VDVAVVAGSSAEYRAVPDHPLSVIQLRRNGNPAVVACWGIPHNYLLLLQAVEEHAAVATSEVSPMVRVTAALLIADRRRENGNFALHLGLGFATLTSYK